MTERSELPPVIGENQESEPEVEVEVDASQTTENEADTNQGLDHEDDSHAVSESGKLSVDKLPFGDIHPDNLTDEQRRANEDYIAEKLA